MSESVFGPDADSPGAAWADPEHAPYRAPDVPISAVPSAAPDYAEWRATADPYPDRPIELRQVPEAPRGYQPAPVFEDGPAIERPAASPTTPASPIVHVPLDRPAPPVTPGEVIVDVPFAVPTTEVTESDEAPVDLIQAVPTVLPSAPPPPPAEVPVVENPKTPWWKLLIGGS